MIMERSEGATALLGLDGFVAGAQVKDGGEAWILVETVNDVAGCPLCGTKAIGNGRREVKVRDLPARDRPVVLVWRKRTWRCPAPECPVNTFFEEVDVIAPRACLTERARAEICRRVGGRRLGGGGRPGLRGGLAHGLSGGRGPR